MARRMHTRKITKPVVKEIKKEIVKPVIVKTDDTETIKVVENTSPEVKKWKEKRNKRNKKG